MTPTQPEMYLWEDPPAKWFDALWAGREVDVPSSFALWVYYDWLRPRPGSWAKLVEMLPYGRMTGRTISAQLMERDDGSRYWRAVTLTNERDRAGTKRAPVADTSVRCDSCQYREIVGLWPSPRCRHGGAPNMPVPPRPPARCPLEKEAASAGTEGP